LHAFYVLLLANTSNLSQAYGIYLSQVFDLKMVVKEQNIIETTTQTIAFLRIIEKQRHKPPQ